MSVLRQAAPLVLLVLLGIIGLGAEEKPLLVIVDRSMSMRDNDERNFSTDSTHLALGTLREGKPIVVIGFAGSARPLLAPTTVDGNAKRRALRDDRLGSALRYLTGGTNYVGALEAAYEQLTNLKAPAGTRVFFFTDGAPSNKTEEIVSAAEAFRQQGWVIDGLALTTAEAKMTEDMRRITEITRGSYTEVNRAEDLVESFNDAAARENDYFTLNVERISADTEIKVLPGSERLIWISVRDGAGQGSFETITYNGHDYPITDDESCYHYPANLADRGNIQLLNFHHPEPGNWFATYDGQPSSVYVNLALPLRVETLPLPDVVYEWDVITPGIRVITRAQDSQLIDAIKSAGRVEAVIRDSQSGWEMAHLDLDVVDDAGGLRFEKPVTVTWPPDVPRSGERPYQIDYRFNLYNQWRLSKKDAFLVRPRKDPPAPSLKPAVAQLALPPAWTDQERQARLATAVIGAPQSAITVPAAGHFRFRYVPDAQAIDIAHHSAASGHFTTTLGQGIMSDGKKVDMDTVQITADVYDFAGERILRLPRDGATPVAGWVPTPAGAQPQPFQGCSFTLDHDRGGQAQVAIDADGQAQVVADPSLPAGRLTGRAQLPYGGLDPVPVEVVYDYEPPKAGFTWPEDALDRPGRADERDWMDLDPVSVVMTEGLPGTVSVRLSDFTGPQGDVLSAAFDLRASVSPMQCQPGDRIAVQVRAYRGQDLPGGVYSGTVTLVHSAPGGQHYETSRPMTITIDE